jgi:hypothetical protein
MTDMSSEWPPARKGQSIRQYVSEHLGPDGALNPEDASLPDEGCLMTGELKWAPGAMDGFSDITSASVTIGKTGRAWW